MALAAYLVSSAEATSIKVIRFSSVRQMVSKIKDYYGQSGLVDKTFAVWGLSFKPETDDVRESPAAQIIDGLLKEGAKVRAYDPAAEESFHRMYALPVEYAQDMYSCLEGADAMVLITEWHQFRRPDFVRMKQLMVKPVIFDGRNQFDPDYLLERGFTYISIGRAPVNWDRNC
ncbi:hypothetical protein ES703_120156 [subsurface metagenome]